MYLMKFLKIIFLKMYLTPLESGFPNIIIALRPRALPGANTLKGLKPYRGFFVTIFSNYLNEYLNSLMVFLTCILAPS
jgi:hypothetical protein